MAASYYRGLATIELRKNFSDLKGAMMAVGCTKEEMEPLLAGLSNKNIRIACYNSPTSLTISGDAAAVDELQAVMEQKEMFNRKLQVDVAYHSHHMELVADNYRKALSSLEAPCSTTVKFHSSLFGKLVDGIELQPSYWVDNLTQAVRFSEALTTMCDPVDQFKTGVNMLIEIGPHSALGGPVKQILKACGANAMKIPYMSALVRKRDAVETALELASTLFVKGAPLDMSAVNLSKKSKQPTLLVDMPRYPWNHATKYWHEPRVMQKHKNRSAPRNDLLGVLATYSNDLEPTWRNIIRVDDLPWLRHHKVQGLTLFPMSGFLAMAIEAAYQRANTRNVTFNTYELRDVTVSTPLMITDVDVEITIQLRPHQEASLSSSETCDEFRIHSWATNGGWTEHCKGLIMVQNKTIQKSISGLTEGEAAYVDTAQMYDTLSDLGVAYGATFQGLSDCQANHQRSVANITVTDTAQEMPQGHQTSMIAHPAFLEQLIEMYWPILGAGRTAVNTVYLPSSIGRLTISQDIAELSKVPGNHLRATCERISSPTLQPKPILMSMSATSVADLEETIIMLENLTISPIVENEMGAEEEDARELCYKLDWESALNLDKEAAPESFPKQAITIIHADSEAQRELAAQLATTIETLTGVCPVTGLLADVDATDKLCLFVAELEKPLLSRLTAEEFTSLQKTLTSVQGILWMVRGAYVDASNPDLNMVTGLSRSIRSETLLKFATLDIEPKEGNSASNDAKAILTVFQAVFNSESDPNCELEFVQRKGEMYTPRIIHDTEMNEHVHKQQKTSQLELVDFKQDDRSLRLAITQAGALDTLHFVDQVYAIELGSDEVEIAVQAIGLNSRDLSIVSGHNETAQFGSECSGIVTKVGSEVTGFSVGSHVAAVSLVNGAFSNLARVKADHAFEIGVDISFETAASIPLAYGAAHYALHSLARLEVDDTILVHGASSAIGQAAITLALKAGARVFALVSNDSSKREVQEKLGLTHDHVLINDEDNIRWLARNNSIDIVVNCTATKSHTSRELWAVLNSFGRYVDCSQQNQGPRLDTSLCGGNKSFLSVDIESLVSEKPKILKRLLSEMGAIFKNSPPTLLVTSFPISEIEAAFKVLQSGNFDGKLVVSSQPGDQVKATPSSRSGQILRSDASYLLIGGTGGLGRSMARWMISKGARNLVLISRSGSSTGKVQELIEEAADLGATIVVKRCDVAKKDDVDRLITEELSGVPEIKGVVHGAMVLNVS